MKIKELIAKLQKGNPELEVVVYSAEPGTVTADFDVSLAPWKGVDLALIYELTDSKPI